MENSLKGLILAAGIVITCLVIGVGFYVSRQSKDQATDAASQITGITSEYDEPAKMVYDGATVTGKEVVNVINKYKDDSTMAVAVKTVKAPATYVSYGTRMIALVDAATGVYGLDSANAGAGATSEWLSNTARNGYINPAANFKGEVVRDKNNVICGILFTQTGVVYDGADAFAPSVES